MLVFLTTDNLPEQSPGASDEPAMMYYINDGVYGSFNCLLYDHAAVTTSPVQVIFQIPIQNFIMYCIVFKMSDFCIFYSEAYKLD